MKFEALKDIAGGVLTIESELSSFDQLITDSRQSFQADRGLFLAISGERHNGHDFLQYMYEKGVRQFIVEDNTPLNGLPVNVLVVANTLLALQELASYHRSQFFLPVIGITGSNGKTIVKEWLYQMTSPFMHVVKSPHSYNSQLGVPLSVWHINHAHNLAIFEAGISQTGEMIRLEKIIKPDIGIFCNIGSAHAEGFRSTEEKAKEKAFLFKHCNQVIYCQDHPLLDDLLQDKSFTWGEHPDSNVRITHKLIESGKTSITLSYLDCQYHFLLPFTGISSIENAMHCISFMLLKGFDSGQIQKGLNLLRTLPMRLMIKKAIGNSYLIDDTYNNDLAGLKIALDFLNSQNQHSKKVLILSDLLQSGMDNARLYKEVAEVVSTAGIDQLIGIGNQISAQEELFKAPASFYPSTESFINSRTKIDLTNCVILVKGARSFGFERIIQSLEEQIHTTQLEIDLEALVHNYNYYKSRLTSGTKIMVMVKAFGYGAGSLEVANLLQYHNVDYLGVAYTDEGVSLRQNGIRVPIMVMNPTVDAFDKILKFNLEPEIYSLCLLKSFIQFLNGRKASIQLKLDTGMKRLGFEAEDLDSLISILKDTSGLTVSGIFSHLAGSDEERHNSFSQQQATLYNDLTNRLVKELQINPIRHLVNSSGILRFPQYHFDMVRLGIGLYGLETNHLDQNKLQSVSCLKTTISQIKKVKKGETIGYGRKGIASADLTIATIAIGYADGFPRALGNGIGEVFIGKKKARVIGSVCMDMTMIDITEIQAKVGDEVEIFGQYGSLNELAVKLETIPYEILTNVSQRVKRVYARG